MEGKSTTQSNPTEKDNLPSTQVSDISSMPTKKKKEDHVIGPNERAFDKGIKSILKLYVLPIVVIFIFFSFLLFGVIPNTQEIFSTMGEISTVYEEKQLEDDKVAELQTLASQLPRIEEDITLINDLTNQAESIVVFQDMIGDLAEDTGLQVTQQTTGERIISNEFDDFGFDDPDANTVQDELNLIEIPSIFSMQGKLADIKEFINSLNDLDDFIVVGEMELTVQGETIDLIRNSQEAIWGLEITLTKYQFQDVASDESAKQFLNVELQQQPNSSVMNYIRNKNN